MTIIMDIKELGEIGQEKGRKLCRECFIETVFQIDWMSLTKNGIYILNEVKNQEPFEPPPFEGQGLPIRQVKARMRFYENKGIRCRFIVFNPLDESEVLWQWLDILEEGQYHDTHINPRRIYPVKNFKRLDYYIAIRIFGLEESRLS